MGIIATSPTDGLAMRFVFLLVLHAQTTEGKPKKPSFAKDADPMAAAMGGMFDEQMKDPNMMNDMMFDMLDANHNGWLSRKELRSMFDEFAEEQIELGKGQEAIKKSDMDPMFDWLDQNKDGKIQKSELISMNDPNGPLAKASKPPDMDELMKGLKGDGGGMDMDYLKKMMGGMGGAGFDKEIEEMMKGMQGDMAGSAEMADMMRQMGGKGAQPAESWDDDD